MDETIHVPADNSDHSNASLDLAVSLGASFGSKLVGSHVYAASLHDVRFKQMEFTLPDEYKEEEELEKQRKIHDALIARGLHLISDSYLDQAEKRCIESGIEFERKHFDGKNFESIVEDVNASGYDLVILGALGMGAVKQSEIGSVCERVLRRTSGDTLVVRDAEIRDAATGGALLVALDGSPASYGGLRSALRLAKEYGKAVEVVAVQDPRRPETALLQTHLRLAEELGNRASVELTTALLQGAPREALLARAETVQPWAIVLGRNGLDGDPGTTELGSVVDHVVRCGRFNVLLSGRTWNPAQAFEESDANVA